MKKVFKGFTPVKMCGLSPLASFCPKTLHSNGNNNKKLEITKIKKTPTFFSLPNSGLKTFVVVFFYLGGLALSFKRTMLPLLSHSPNSINEYGLVAVGTLEPNSL